MSNYKDNIILDYSDLNRFIFSSKDDYLPNQFYHYTEVNNAASIINSGFIKSRYSVKNDGSIVYDNLKKNSITFNVMITNASYRIERYARFYLNVRNKTTYSMKMNFKNNNTFGVIIAIDFSSIWRAHTNVLLTPKSAHYADDKFFDFKNGRNIDFKYNLRNLNVNDYNFSETFKTYNNSVNNEYQMAEILFLDKVSIDFISYIYFANDVDKSIFLGKIDKKIINKIINKCRVNKYLHWEV